MNVNTNASGTVTDDIIALKRMVENDDGEAHDETKQQQDETDDDDGAESRVHCECETTCGLSLRAN